MLPMGLLQLKSWAYLGRTAFCLPGQRLWLLVRNGGKISINERTLYLVITHNAVTKGGNCLYEMFPWVYLMVFLVAALSTSDVDAGYNPGKSNPIKIISTRTSLDKDILT